MKGRTLIRRAVVSLSEAAEVGKIQNIVFDREAQVGALIVMPRGRNKRELAATAISNVRSVGRDAITIEDSGLVEGSEKVEEYRTWPNLHQLIGCRVITEGGTYLGQIRDVVLDEDGRRITDFDIVGRGVIGHLRGDLIPATGRLRFGTEIVIVPNVVTLKGKALLEPVVETIASAQIALPVVGRSDPADTTPSAVEAVLANNPKVSHRESNGEEGLTRAVGG